MNPGDARPPRERFVEANRLTHHVIEWEPAAGASSALPVVLAHGFLDQAWSFEAVARILARDRRVIAFDWRGHGESEWIGRGGYYHFADYLLDLSELLPQIAGEHYHLVGHSMGGTACAMFAATHPEGLRSLVLCEGLGPPARRIQDTPDRLRDFVRSVAKTRTGPSTKLRDLDDAARRLRNQHSELDDARARSLAERATVANADGTRSWRFDPLHRTSSASAFVLEMFVAVLERIDVPTLVVTGERGFRTPDHQARVGAIPAYRELVVPGASHMMHWHAPEALAAAIAEHVGAVESRERG